MDRKLVYNYIQLCKKNDYNLINNISSDINLVIAPELVAQKYGVSINEVLGISEIIKYEDNLGCNGLKYVFDTYNSLVGGKGGKGKSGKIKSKSKNKNKKKNKDKKEKDNDENGIEEIAGVTGVVALAHDVLTSDRARLRQNSMYSQQKPTKTNQDPDIQKILSGLAGLLSKNNKPRTTTNLKEILPNIKEIVSSEVSDIFKKASKNLQSGGNKNILQESSDMSPVVLSDN
jgi:hypothetical protein